MVFNSQIPGPDCTAKAYYTENAGKIDVSEVRVFDPVGAKYFGLSGNQLGSPYPSIIDAHSQIAPAINNIPLDFVKGAPPTSKP